jgi:hypothetical protein
MPDWKRTVSSVAFAGLAYIDTVNGDLQAIPADCLSRKRQHALEHRHTDRQIAVEIKKRSEQIRGLHGDEFSNGQACRSLNTIKADRNAV